MSPAPSITGKTRLYAIVGDPVVQVRSPQVYCAEFAKAGVDAVLVPMHIAAAEIHDVLPALLKLKNLDGVLVTSPFKADAMSIAAEVHPRARRVGAVNALRRGANGLWFGDMFDGEGFVRGILAHGHKVSGRRALVLGCGGAGSAIAGALIDAGVSSITVFDPDEARAQNVSDALSKSSGACRVTAGSADAAGKDLIVNASVVGMRESDGMPADFSTLTADVLVGDVVLRPEDRPTALIAHAKRCGCPVVTGVDMHEGQVDAILEFFGIYRSA
ncbi:shikimate dehydrogenase [Paraburkholderia sp. UYCP14C]|uniref:shikimate dehydrogenase family protein n=1 Tax=Paraburkholderia sp. UYCP14C TaxID=2511130 RepID=UPI00101FE696|nr:ThiF family adenylyltransferase [Paraburkholderia sp. UYCP14C]RZF29011.1 shikimate dehydrogenase [Paraburkholderia sp. UYCP14C]